MATTDHRSHLFPLSPKNPDVVATSCPFCRVMLSNGVGDKGMSEKVQVTDVMEIVATNMETRV